MRDWRKFITERLSEMRIRPAREAEIVAELSAHLEQAYSDARAVGMTDEEALREAETRFANWRELAREIEDAEPDSREARWSAKLSAGALGDIRHTLRSFGRNPAFAAIAIGTLAF